MGYTTYFDGSVNVEPPLNAEEIAYLNKFNQTRRMSCEQGPYYVDRGGFMGQGAEAGEAMILNSNEPPDGQPGLWCQWIPSEDGTQIEWDGGEKFYSAAEWMDYLIEHFIGARPLAKSVLPFLAGHVCNGEIYAHGEDSEDHWKIVVEDNVVSTQTGRIVYG